MIHNNINMNCDNKMSSKPYGRQSNQRRLNDDGLYANIRSRFLQQSARYFGAELSGSNVQFLRFGNLVYR